MRTDWDAGVLQPLGARGAEIGADVERALGDGRAEDAARAICEAGDALANLGLVEPTIGAFEAAWEMARSAGANRLAAGVAWRLGEVREVLARPDVAADWYERAAEGYASVGAIADQVAALEAGGRVRLMSEGGQGALRLLREAVRLARADGDERLLAGAMEQVAAAAFEIHLYDDANASFREAARLYRRCGEPEGHARATIGVAECAIAEGDHVRAIQMVAPIEDALGRMQDEETRGRSLGLVALFQLEAGEREGAAENFEAALEAFERADAPLRRGRLLMAFARRLEASDGGSAAVELYLAALAIYEGTGDLARIGPAAYAAARCYAEMGDLVQADGQIERALEVCHRLGDVEGLDICTRLAVRVAVQLGQGALALDRMRLAARLKGELGDGQGEVRYLMSALEAVTNLPDMDPERLADELIEALRRTGTRHLTEEELRVVVDGLATAGRPGHASEVMALIAHHEVDAARYAKAARAYAEAARYAVQDEAPGEAGALWDQAIAIGERYKLADVEEWRIDRATFGVDAQA